MPNPGAQRTCRTPEIIEQIADDLSLGMFRFHAAARAGIAETTLLTWCAEDPSLELRLNQAEALGVRGAALTIRRAMEEPDQYTAASVAAAKLYLQTRHRGAWVIRQHVEHSGSIRTVDDAVHATLSPPTEGEP